MCKFSVKKSVIRWTVVIVSTIAIYLLIALCVDTFHHKTKYEIWWPYDICYEHLTKIKINNIECQYQKEFTVNDSFKGIINVIISGDFAGDIEEIAGDKEGFVYNDFTEYIDSYKCDMEVTVFPAEYMPWVKAAGYGWLNDDGNLYAQMFGAEAAEDKPNYRNKFSFVARKGEIYYQVTGFCDTRDFELFVEKTVELINENFVTEQE